MPKPFKLPPMFFVASISASLLLAAGFIGLFAPEVVPVLADRTIAIACIAAGAMLELWSVMQLISATRQHAEKNRRP